MEPLPHGRISQGGRGHAAQLVTLGREHRQGGSAQTWVLLNTGIISPTRYQLAGRGLGLGVWVGGSVSTQGRPGPTLQLRLYPPAPPAPPTLDPYALENKHDYGFRDTGTVILYDKLTF